MEKEYRLAKNQDEATLCLVSSLGNNEVLEDLKAHLKVGKHVQGLQFIKDNGVVDYVSYSFGDDIQPLDMSPWGEMIQGLWVEA